MSKIIDADRKSNYHEELKAGYLHFAPQIKKTIADVIDADTKQADALEVKPRPQPEVIVA